MKQMPTMASQILKRNIHRECHDDSFHYRSVTGRLNYLEKCTRLDIFCAMHQCVHFSADPKWAHANAVRWIGRYLLATKDVYVNSDFSRNWDPEGVPDDPDTAQSRTGFIIEYAGCPLIWASKMQTLIALSSSEAEYAHCSKYFTQGDHSSYGTTL